jgi:hypothetical protein
MNHLVTTPSFLAIFLIGMFFYFREPAIKWRRRRRWQIKGLPLRGARVSVDSITPLPPPAVENPFADDTRFRRYFVMNVTIRPMGGRWSRIAWTPSDLRLVPAEHWCPILPDEADLGCYCRIESLEVVCGATCFTINNEFTVAGPFDLRLRLAVRQDIRALQFRYYLELFGAIRLPAEAQPIVVNDESEIERQPAPPTEP